MLKKKEQEKKLTVIIVTYNSANIIANCLQDIVSPELKIIIVDNASEDNTVEIVSLYKDKGVSLIQSSNNVGYGRAANIALKSIQTEYSLLINPDVKTSANVIMQLVQNAENHPKAVLTAPRISTNKNYNLNLEFEKVHWVSGAVMLFNMRLLKKIGYFDENIFLFYEETDLCKRILQAEYEILRFNSITMEHIIGASTTNKQSVRYARYWHTGWSCFYFSKKHESDEKFRKTVMDTTENYLSQLNLSKDNAEKTMQYNALILGGVAFLSGVKAFDSDGYPEVTPE